MTLKELISKRAQIWGVMEEIVQRGEWSAEDKQKYDAAEVDLRAATEDIARLERHAATEKVLEETRTNPVIPTGVNPEDRGGKTVTDEQYREAFDQYLRRGMSEMDADKRETLRAGFVSGEELRAQGLASGAVGGFTVPQGFRAVLTETMKAFSGARQVANIISTETGNDLPWPGNDDTGNEGEILTEHAPVPEQDLVFTSKTLKAHMYTSKMTKLGWALLQDSAFDLPTYIAKKHGERIGRVHNRHFTVGDGVNKPKGMVTAATVGKTGAAGQVTTVTYNDIIDLIHSVDPAYRNERCAFQFHDLTLAKLRKLVDNDGRPLWQPMVSAGAPDTFAGQKYVVNNHMPEMAASAKSILFGDYTAGYIIRDVRDIQTVRLNERFAENLQVAFFSVARADGLDDANAAYKAYQNPAA